MTNQFQPNAEKETVFETVRGAVAGDDAPMETGHRVASAALVGATYPIVLVVLLIVGLVIAYFTSRPTDDVRGPSTSDPVPEVAR
jgi:hypothetical protein